MTVPWKPLELSNRDDPASPTVPALQLGLHHPAHEQGSTGSGTVLLYYM
jgi:hypothetical protein